MRSLAGKLLLAICSLVLTLAFFEAAFRILDYRGFHTDRISEWEEALMPAKDRVEGVHLQFIPQSSWRLIYDSNPRGYFDDDNSLTFQMNNYGFRGPDIQVPKPDGVFRVLMLGDSFTFGAGVRLEHTFVHRMSEIMKSEVSDDIEVVNCGVSSWSTGTEITYLEKMGMSLEPDLVVVVFIPNDADYAAQFDLWNEFRASYEPPDWLRRSYILTFIYAPISREIAGRRYVKRLARASVGIRSAQFKWRKTLRLLKKGKDIAKAGGAEYAIVMFPFMFKLDDSYPLHAIHDKVRKVSESNDIPYSDLFGAFKGNDYMDLWVHGSDQHPNEVGHEIAARAIADFLVEEELVGRR